MISKEEIQARFDAINNELTIAMKDRPTIGYFKQVLAAYDTKMDHFNDFFNEQMERLDGMGSQLNEDFVKINDQFDELIKKIDKEMGQKMDKNDATRIWQHFQRFAEYSDLKDLYSKTIPELAKFEQKIIDF